MPKNSVFPYMTFTQFIDEPTLKRLAIFFDNIYVSEPSLSIILNTNPNQSNVISQSLAYEKAVWEYLLDSGIVKQYPFFPAPFDEEPDNPDVKALSNLIKSAIPPPGAKKATSEDIAKMSEEEKAAFKQRIFNHYFLSHDLSARLDAVQLRKDTNSKFYPILRTNFSIEAQEKKSSVIQFLLNEVPEPVHETPWEQIIEFRSDDDVRNKYLALVNWINKAALSSSSLSDLKDEYEYLYSEYMKHFKLHRMKYNTTTLEIVVNAGTALLLALQSGQVVPAIKNLLQLKASRAGLLQEEAKLPGKEVAYIYHAKNQFGNSL